MNSNEQVLLDLNVSTQQIINILDQIPADRFNFGQGQSWSVSDCLEHLIMVEGFILNVINGETMPLQDRQPDQFVSGIKSRFTNRDQKLDAPPPIAPPHEERVKEIQKQAFVEKRNQLTAAFEHLNLTDICLGHKHKMFGELTRYEWAYFTIFHSDRHAIQITEAAEKK